MLEKQLRQEWRAREHTVPISQDLRFAPKGLVLGAGTVVVAAEALQEAQQGRVLALLSAAYGRPIEPRVLGNIERAMKCWRDGDDCLAYIHLAHAGLWQLQEPYEASRRLFVADEIMKTGISPRAIFEALGFDAAYVNRVEKLYNSDEPRVPAGSGKTSGQWTRLLSILGDLTAEAADALGRFGVALVSGVAGDAVAAFGLLFIPSPNDVRVEGGVSGMPGLHYAWDRDESLLRLTYNDTNGQRHIFTASLDEEVFRDVSGRVVGRVLPDGSIAIDTAAVSSNLTQSDQPRLCPAPGTDKFGSVVGRAYEDFVKQFVNPENPTPSGMGYQLPNPGNNGKLVNFDDCQHVSGALFEIKGNYAGILAFPQAQESVEEEFLDESARQLAAAGGREVIWVFAEASTAEYVIKLFETNDDGRNRIGIVVVPWVERGP
ncbi:MAG TPA: hypothetical protein VGH13_01185 [Xanthobacteraceae bacterium]